MGCLGFVGGFDFSPLGGERGRGEVVYFINQ